MKKTPGESAFARQAKEAWDLPAARLERFIREGEALRQNLSLRKRQQQERSKKCMHSK